MLAEPKPNLTPITKNAIKAEFQSIGYTAKVKTTNYTFARMGTIAVFKDNIEIYSGNGNVIDQAVYTEHKVAFALHTQLSKAHYIAN